METKDIQNKKWFIHGRWIQPPLSGGFWQHWHKSACAHDILPDGPWPELLFLDGYQLTSQADVDEIEQFVVSSYDAGRLSALLENVEVAADKYEKRHLALLDNTLLSRDEYILELFDSYQELLGPWAFMFRFFVLERVAKERGLVSSDDDLLARIRPYRRPTWLEKQAADVQSFVRTIKERYPSVSAEDITLEFLRPDATLFAEIQKHVEEFDWFGTHHWEGEGYTLEKCVADIRALFQHGASHTSDPVVHTDNISATEGDEILWRVIESSFYWRTHCAEVTAKVVYRSRPQLIALAQSWGISYDELTFLTADEIAATIKKGGALVLPHNFHERMKGYGAYLNDDSEHIIVGEDLRKHIGVVVPPVDESITEVKGDVASRGGVVIGIACIVLSPRDFAKFQEGQILIVPETAPDFVPLIKKAKAIVTETGGITSHAAIVSRELKKLCVIGTKIATKVFHDGDIVEVDAEEGIVRLVERA